MSNREKLGGSFGLAGTELNLNRMGYGAMQLAGPGVFGPPKDARWQLRFCVKPSTSA